MLSVTGRHRATKTHRTTAQRLIASAGLVGVGLAVPLVTATTASAATVSTWDKVAQCESTGDWSINTGNGYYGGLQFSASTWAAYGGTQYASSADQATKDQQIAVAEKVLASQGPTAWPVCGPQAGLTQGGAAASVDTSSSSSSASSSSSDSSSSSSSDASSASSSSDKSASSDTSSSSTATSGSYTVVAGDWLSTIAAKENVSGGWERLYALNRSVLSSGPDVIYPGQKLTLGSASGSSSSSTSSDTASDASSTTSSSGSSSDSSAGSGSSSSTTTTASDTSTSSSSGMAAAASFALSKVGESYVYGGTSDAGWDCSGLVQAALAKAGVSVPRTSEEQAAASTRVSLDSLQVGDLLFWSSDGTASGAYHVAIYVGNGEYVEAANPSSGVKTDTISNWAPDFAGRIG